MKFRPMFDRVLVKRKDAEDRSKGGIIIPDVAKEKPEEGEVVDTGRGKLLDDGTIRELDVKRGDKVLFGKFAGTEVKIDGQLFVLMREDDILGILHEG